MNDLADFLLARIKDDEAVARRLTRLIVADLRSCGMGSHEPALGLPSATMTPARALAECEAKWRIVDVHEPIDYSHLYPNAPTVCRPCQEVDGYGGESIGDRGAWPCETIKALALPYADHPDYRPEWGDA